MGAGAWSITCVVPGSSSVTNVTHPGVCDPGTICAEDQARGPGRLALCLERDVLNQLVHQMMTQMTNGFDNEGVEGGIQAYGMANDYRGI